MAAGCLYALGALRAESAVPAIAALGPRSRPALAALAMIGVGAERRGGERGVPLHVWRTATFQAWYAAARAAGHRLDGARLESQGFGPDEPIDSNETKKGKARNRRIEFKLMDQR